MDMGLAEINRVKPVLKDHILESQNVVPCINGMLYIVTIWSYWYAIGENRGL